MGLRIKQWPLSTGQCKLCLSSFKVFPSMLHSVLGSERCAGNEHRKQRLRRCAVKRAGVVLTMPGQPFPQQHWTGKWEKTL